MRIFKCEARALEKLQFHLMKNWNNNKFEWKLSSITAIMKLQKITFHDDCCKSGSNQCHERHDNNQTDDARCSIVGTSDNPSSQYPLL